jgi:phage tail sheath protein FI
MDLVAVPDAVTLSSDNGDTQSIAVVQAATLSHCASLGNRFAILDSLPGATVEGVRKQCQKLAAGQQAPLNGALYYPWLITPDTPIASVTPSSITASLIAPGTHAVPPCGHVAGIYGRSDATRGVFKAPANEEVIGALDLETQIDRQTQDRLNPGRINCLRAFPGRGIRVWGARTLGLAPPDDDDLPEDDPWLYVNVRRLFLTVGRWIDFNMAWTAFEPNNARLWFRIQRELTMYLANLQLAGGLKGATAAEGFYVKCDAENNPADTSELGQVTIDLGLAPLAPSEFIVVRITQSAGGASNN